MLRFSCPKCRRGIRCTDSLAGRVAKCPGCGHGLTVPPAGGDKWYFVVDGSRFGPVEKSALLRLAAQKKLKPSDKVWSKPLGKQWVDARRVDGLFSAPESKGAHGPSVATPAFGRTTAASGHESQIEGNALVMKKARESLKGHWGMAMVVMLLTWVISGIPIIGFFLAGPLTVGMSYFYLKLIRTGKGEVQYLFDKTELFLPSLAASFWIGSVMVGVMLVPILLAVNFYLTKSGGLVLICCIFAWLFSFYLNVLFSMTYFILSDGKACKGIEAVRLSAKWMKKHWEDGAELPFNFIGWSLICFLTGGIGFLWLGPYMAASQAWFYESVKE